jgi:hypothetical protein
LIVCGGFAMMHSSRERHRGLATGPAPGTA